MYHRIVIKCFKIHLYIVATFSSDTCTLYVLKNLHQLAASLDILVVVGLTAVCLLTQLLVAFSYAVEGCQSLQVGRDLETTREKPHITDYNQSGKN